jgi:hypothetical protein
MALPQIQYTIKYVTGSAGVGAIPGEPRNGSVNFLLYNEGTTDEHAMVEVVKWTSFPQTEIVWRSDETYSLIQPNEAQLFEYLAAPFDGTRYWGRIYVTSEELVPSVEFMVNDADSDISTVLVYYAPGDFKRFALPHWLRGGFQLPPIGPILQ